MEKISWTDREQKIIGHILPRNRLLNHVIERNMKGKIYGKTRQGRRRKHLLDDLKEKKRYWDSKQEALLNTISNKYTS